MVYANVRSVWRDYIIKTINTAQTNKKPFKIFINKHQGNSFPDGLQLNETTVVIEFDWKNDWIKIDEKTLNISGEKLKEKFKFSGIDILQLTPFEDVQFKVDQKLLNNSKRHLKFEWVKED